MVMDFLWYFFAVVWVFIAFGLVWAIMAAAYCIYKAAKPKWSVPPYRPVFQQDVAYYGPIRNRMKHVLVT